MKACYLYHLSIKQFLTTLIIDLSTKSAEIIIMTSFLAHRRKDISRGQFLSALNSLNSKQASKMRKIMRNDKESY